MNQISKIFLKYTKMLDFFLSIWYIIKAFDSAGMA